ncbi:MAG: hypothetical protein ABIJ56_20295 [Pseudomonadota bacterium]
MQNMKTCCIAIAVVFGLAGCPKKEGKTSEPVEPVAPLPEEPAEPAEPAEPEEPALPEVTALEDSRDPAWGGKLGGLDNLKWIVVTKSGGGGEGTAAASIFVLVNGDGGMKWILATSHGEFTVGENGLLLTDEEGEKGFAGYTAVPVESNPDIARVVEKTPVPKKEPKEAEGLLGIDISYEGSHVKAAMAGSFEPPAATAKKPAKIKAGGSKNLGAMAERLIGLWRAAQESGGEDEGEEDEE